LAVLGIWTEIKTGVITVMYDLIDFVLAGLQKGY